MFFPGSSDYIKVYPQVIFALTKSFWDKVTLAKLLVSTGGTVCSTGEMKGQHT